MRWPVTLSSESLVPSPVVMYSMPSRPNTTPPPSWPLDSHWRMSVREAGSTLNVSRSITQRDTRHALFLLASPLRGPLPWVNTNPFSLNFG